jgi:hypothetical protein
MKREEEEDEMESWEFGLSGLLILFVLRNGALKDRQFMHGQFLKGIHKMWIVQSNYLSNIDSLHKILSRELAFTLRISTRQNIFSLILF